jgi:hypothetical protein
MRSGKDTCAVEILKQRGSDGHIEIIPFAKALKQEVTAAALSAGGMENLILSTDLFMQSNGNFIPLPEWVGYDPDADMSDPYCPLGKQRAMLQWWGCEFRRSVDPEYWIIKHREAVEKSTATIILIPDMRFQNEFQYVNARGYTVLVDREGLPYNEHASEHQLDEATGWDYVLDNNGTLEDFKVNALLMFDGINGVS